MRYRRRGVVEAVQWTGENFDVLWAWACERGVSKLTRLSDNRVGFQYESFYMPMLNVGDYLVVDEEDGGLRTRSAIQFEMIYESEPDYSAIVDVRDEFALRVMRGGKLGEDEAVLLQAMNHYLDGALPQSKPLPQHVLDAMNEVNRLAGRAARELRNKVRKVTDWEPYDGDE